MLSGIHAIGKRILPRVMNYCTIIAGGKHANGHMPKSTTRTDASIGSNAFMHKSLVDAEHTPTHKLR